MTPILLPNYRPLRCMTLLTPEILARTQGRVLCVEVDGKHYIADEAHLARAESYSADRIYSAGLSIEASFAQDQAGLSRCGFTPKWLGLFLHDLEEMYRQWIRLKEAEFRAGADRALGSGVIEEAQAIVRRILLLAQSAGVRGLFFSASADWQTRPGLFISLLEISVKGRNPVLRKRLTDLGVTEEMLGRLDALQEELHKDRRTLVKEEAVQRSAAHLLRVMKALLIGEILMLSQAARAELIESRWALYQVGRLFDLTRPAEGPEAPPPAEGPEAPPPAPGPTPASPAPPTGPAVRPAPPAGAPLPACPANPPAATLSANAPSPSGGAAAPPLPPLVPGTVLATLPAEGGPPLSATVQPDGSIRWSPVLAPAAAPRPQAAPRRKRPRRSRPR